LYVIKEQLLAYEIIIYSHIADLSAFPQPWQ